MGELIELIRSLPKTRLKSLRLAVAERSLVRICVVLLDRGRRALKPPSPLTEFRYFSQRQFISMTAVRLHQWPRAASSVYVGLVNEDEVTWQTLAWLVGLPRR